MELYNELCIKSVRKKNRIIILKTVYKVQWGFYLPLTQAYQLL